MIIHYSMMRYGKKQRGMGGQKLYAHFSTEGHEGLMDLEIQVTADEKKMNTIWIFVYCAVCGSGRGRCRNFLVLKWGGGLKVGGGGLGLQIWDLNRAHETERTVFPTPQVFSMCRRRL